MSIVVVAVVVCLWMCVWLMGGLCTKLTGMIAALEERDLSWQAKVRELQEAQEDDILAMEQELQVGLTLTYSSPFCMCATFVLFVMACVVPNWGEGNDRCAWNWPRWSTQSSWMRQLLHTEIAKND